MRLEGQNWLISPNIHLLPLAASGTAETSSSLNVIDKRLMRDLYDIVTVLHFVGGTKVKNLLSFQESYF